MAAPPVPAPGASAIGRTFPPTYGTVDAEHARAFARSIGETNPIFHDEAAARAAGYRRLAVTPTYVFIVHFQGLHPMDLLAELGLSGSAGKLLHAEQGFEFFADICAGDRLTFVQSVADVYEKRGGALLFGVIQTDVTNQDGEKVAVFRATEVMRRDA